MKEEGNTERKERERGRWEKSREGGREDLPSSANSSFPVAELFIGSF